MLLDKESYGRVADALTEVIRQMSAVSVISRAYLVYGNLELPQFLSQVKGLRNLTPSLASPDAEWFAQKIVSHQPS